MKKKYILIAIIVIVILTFFIPVKKDRGSWINDDPIADVGHYMEGYYNMYGIKIWEK